MSKWKIWVRELWGRPLEWKRHLVLSMSSLIFVEHKRLFLMLAWYLFGNIMGTKGKKCTLSIDFHQCLYVECSYTEHSYFLTTSKKQKVTCNSFLCSRILVESKRKRVQSFQFSRDLKLPSFHCCVPRSKSWPRGSPILKQVGTAA